MPAVQETVDQVRRIDVDQYKYGFETLIESDKAPKGLSEDTVRFISAKKGEPQWMLDWRLEAYRRWQTMREPTGWQAVSDEVAGERQRVALERSGREVASTSNNPQRIDGEES